MNTIEMAVLNGFWQKNGLGPLGVKKHNSYTDSSTDIFMPLFTIRTPFFFWHALIFYDEFFGHLFWHLAVFMSTTTSNEHHEQYKNNWMSE